MQTITGKVIRDLKNGGKREIRNAIELCRGLSRHPVQRDFWDMVRQFTTFPDSQYAPLIRRTAADVREEVLKTWTVNLWYMAFSQGAEIIRRDHEYGKEHCWVQWLSCRESLRQQVALWNERGVFVFVLDLVRNGACPEEIFPLLKQNTGSVFLFLIHEDGWDEAWLEQVVQFRQAAFLLEPPCLKAMSGMLLENQALFGVLRSYRDVTDPDLEKREVMKWIQQGCVIGAYYMPGGDRKGDTDYYRELVEIRQKADLEILPWDLQKDPEMIQEMILGIRPVPGHQTVSSAEGA